MTLEDLIQEALLLDPHQSPTPLGGHLNTNNSGEQADSPGVGRTVSARDIYGYKISLSYNFSSSYPHSFHLIAFESRFNESETKTLIV